MTQLTIETLKKRVKIPVIMAPMFIISTPKTVLAACKEGIIGSFPLLNARTVNQLDEWLTDLNDEMKRIETEEGTVAPYAVNFIAHRAHNKRYEEDLKMIEKHQPPIVITSLGDPGPIKEIVSAYGGLVFSDVINTRFAKKAIEKGTDGLVLITNGAGGHGGTLNPFAFIQEVKQFWDGPVILGGAISTGSDVLATEVLGADFAYVGTRFIPAKEMGADEDYKQMIVDSTSQDVVYTPAISGIHANFLLPSLQKVGIDPNGLPDDGKADLGGNRKAWKDIWSAGQGVGSVQAIESMKDIVDQMHEQYEREVERVSQKRSSTSNV